VKNEAKSKKYAKKIFNPSKELDFIALV